MKIQHFLFNTLGAFFAVYAVAARYIGTPVPDNSWSAYIPAALFLFFGNLHAISDFKFGLSGIAAHTRALGPAALSISDLTSPTSVPRGSERIPRLPPHWRQWGDNHYEISLDKRTAHTGKCSAYIKSIPVWRRIWLRKRSLQPPQGFGTLMQTVKANDYRARRLEMSAFCRTDDVRDWAGLWMRVDGSEGEMLGFYNMQDRPISGTTDWTQYRVILDIPEAAETIAFGCLLAGYGTVWCDTFKFAVVDQDTPTSLESLYPDHPLNLDFEGAEHPRSDHKRVQSSRGARIVRHRHKEFA